MDQNSTTERPTFLTVLCILTFIGSGFSLLSGIYNYAMAPMAAEITEEALQQAEEQLAYQDVNEGTAEVLEKTFNASLEMAQHASTLALISVLGALLSLTGAFLMFKLNRKGFFVYTSAQLVLILAPMALVGFNFLTGFTAMLAGFFSVLFIVLYGVNLKHMKA